MHAVLNTVEVAGLLRLSEATVQRHIRAGLLPAIAVGRTWRLRAADVYPLAQGEPVPADLTLANAPEMLTVADAAQVLRVSDEVIRKALNDSSLPGVRIGSGRGQWRIRTKDIDALFDQALQVAAARQATDEDIHEETAE